MEEIKVVIVEDNDEIRDGLAYLINSSQGFVCLAKYSNGEDFLKDFLQEKNNKNYVLPDVILMDINLPGISGIDCIRKIKETKNSIQIMMLTIYEDYDTIYKSLKAGATGYILKKTATTELLNAIKDIYNGGSPMSSQIARKVVLSFQEQKTSKETQNLTPREQEILNYLAMGYRYKEIAALLFISVETVRTHIRNIYEKLHVNSRTEAILKAYPR
ncbi:response regulator transcription factor [Rosettibacter firmus]|uniref:response regulator transcription factor n=1 Tax=Rosettibacter firmus TaxID=3111522 RepID=UPI00336C2B79